jgi:ParB-like chromosome segregation protein Spo0J
MCLPKYESRADGRAELNQFDHSEERCPIDSLVPYKNNARIHSKKQLRQIADSIVRFGFTNPVLVSSDNVILAGHGRV